MLERKDGRTQAGRHLYPTSGGNIWTWTTHRLFGLLTQVALPEKITLNGIPYPCGGAAATRWRRAFFGTR